MKTAVGLDIGWKEVRAVELTEDLRLTKIGRVEIPRPIEGDDSYVYAEKIKELFHKQRFSTDNVIISLRGSPILARTYSAPSENRDDFEKWFVDSIDSLIPGTPIADVVYDYQFLKSGRALISFAKLAAIENKIDIMRKCDIIPASIDASCLALYHAFENHPWLKEKKNFAILDCNIYSTDLLVVRDGEPLVSTEIFLGGKDDDDTFIPELSTNLKKIINYYREKEGFEIKHLILVGDYKDFPGLKNSLNQKIGIESEIGRPFELRKIDLATKFDVENNHYYAHALGLALKGLSPKKEINLMPEEVKKLYHTWQFDKKARSFFKKNALFSGIALVLLLFLLSVLVRANHAISKDVKALDAKKSELSYVGDDERELNARLTKLKQLSNEPFLWSKTLQNLGRAVPEGINLVAVATESRLTSVENRPERKTKIVIEGDARDKETVLVFVKNLEENFKNIALNNMKEEVRCEFKISLTP